MEENNKAQSDFVVVKALEDGVNVMGLTRGGATWDYRGEKLGGGEVYIAQFTETTSAIKINGRASILTAYGAVESGTRGERR